MWVIWKQCPDLELWIVGSNPPNFLKDLGRDERVHVTGFVEHPQDILKTSCRWCFVPRPERTVSAAAWWKLALGVTVVASWDAVSGMGLEPGHGIALAESTVELATWSLRWLSEPSILSGQSRRARRQVEEKFGYEATYACFAVDLSKQHRKPLQC